MLEDYEEYSNIYKLETELEEAICEFEHLRDLLKEILKEGKRISKVKYRTLTAKIKIQELYIKDLRIRIEDCKRNY